MPENQNIEWKSNWRDEYLKWICGFANAQGGVLFVGMDDNGNIINLSNYQTLMDELPNKVKDMLGILCEINLHEDSSVHYIEIVTKPYDVPISFRGKYYYRSGSTNQLLEGSELMDFLMRKSGRTWDDVVEPNAGITDISDKAIDVFKSGAVNSRRLNAVIGENDTNQLLDNLRLRDGDHLKRAALLLFGSDPMRFVNNAFVKIGKFGKSDSDLKFQEIVEGNIIQLADSVIEILENKFLTSPISYDGLHRVEEAEYPFGAVREALLNAIVHKDYNGVSPIQVSVYDDKLIFWNEGILPDGLSIEELKKKHPSRPRNPLLADVCFKSGLIEAWGRGTIRIVEECLNFGLPEPVFEIIGGGIQVTISKDIYDPTFLTELGLSYRQIKGVMFAKEKGQITNSEYQEIASVSKATATRDLTELLEKWDVLKKVGETGIGTKYVINY